MNAKPPRLTRIKLNAGNQTRCALESPDAEGLQRKCRDDLSARAEIRTKRHKPLMWCEPVKEDIRKTRSHGETGITARRARSAPD